MFSWDFELMKCTWFHCLTFVLNESNIVYLDPTISNIPYTIFQKFRTLKSNIQFFFLFLCSTKISIWYETEKRMFSLPKTWIWNVICSIRKIHLSKSFRGEEVEVAEYMYQLYVLQFFYVTDFWCSDRYMVIV